MTRYLVLVAPLVFGCTAVAQPPPSLKPGADLAETVVEEIADDLEVQDTALADLEEQEETVAANVTRLEGSLAQGGLVFGKTTPGASVRLVVFSEGDDIADSRDVLVDSFGNFVFGFDRDHGPSATLMVTYPGEETSEPKVIPVEPKPWRESRITVEASKANPYKKEDLDKIARDRTTKANARRNRADDAMWVGGFEWPADGCVSSDFGSRRIVNGTPRRPHSGVDVAAPDGMSPMDYIGTEVRAPAEGIVRLAESDMFFEGGMVFIDHGQRLETALMHLSKVDVQVGQRVQQGDKVGEVGMTGRVTGPHLHWSLKWQDRLLDARQIAPPREPCTD